MRFLTIFVFSFTFLHAQLSYAQGPMTSCIENEETPASISYCMTVVNKDLEKVRLTIEADVLAMANEYDDRLRKHERKNIKKKQTTNTEDAIALKIEEIDFQIGMRHLSKKYRNLGSLKESQRAFEEYRDIECHRHRNFLTRKSYEAAFAAKVCYYELTNQRIK